MILSSISFGNRILFGNVNNTKKQENTQNNFLNIKASQPPQDCFISSKPKSNNRISFLAESFDSEDYAYYK